MNALAIVNELFSPAEDANNSVINATAAAYSCMLEIAEMGLQLTGRIDLHSDIPTVWIEPPDNPLRQFGWYAINPGTGTENRSGTSQFRNCHVCWEE